MAPSPQRPADRLTRREDRLENGPPGEWEQMVIVGRIARAHGIRGQVIVNPETDFPGERFRTGQVLYVRRCGRIEPMAITSVRFHRGRPILGLAGTETMNDAESLAGHELRIPESALTPLPEATFYRHDLIGCVVVTTEGAEIGTVVDLEGTLERSRLIVRGAPGDVLVPLTAPICVDVDIARRLIVIDPPEGLLDLNVTRRRI
jgi:16S rRNA processing protein RimM